MMLENLAASDNEIRKTFAEKAKNMVGLIGQNLQNHFQLTIPLRHPACYHCSGGPSCFLLIKVVINLIGEWDEPTISSEFRMCLDSGSLCSLPPSHMRG